MIWTNNDSNGGSFLQQVESEFKDSNNVTIASGYVSLDVVNKFYSSFERVIKKGGQARLLVGMAFYEGLTSHKLTALTRLSTKLEQAGNGSGVFVSYNGKYHGKTYLFEGSNGKNYYVGSSNFSRSGLLENLECTALISDQETQAKIQSYIDFLFMPENAVSILKAEIVVPGTSEYKKRISLETLDDLPKHDIKIVDISELPRIDYPLSRIVDKEKSNLNVYFGKGRLNTTTGKILARPWYEVELIANREITSNPLYPKGDFTSYTDDDYIMPMKTSGDYFKNIRSRGNLSLLGQWIKGKLQKSGALIPLTPVTRDTLDAYGNDTIQLYKMSDNNYYMKF